MEHNVHQTYVTLFSPTVFLLHSQKSVTLLNTFLAIIGDRDLYTHTHTHTAPLSS